MTHMTSQPEQVQTDTMLVFDDVYSNPNLELVGRVDVPRYSQPTEDGVRLSEEKRKALAVARAVEDGHVSDGDGGRMDESVLVGHNFRVLTAIDGEWDEVAYEQNPSFDAVWDPEEFSQAGQRMTNDKMDIPEGERIDVEDETDLDVDELPGNWEWRTANHYSNNKTNVYFGLDVHETGGYLGEIDNYIEDGDEVWDVHVRPIVDVPGEDRNRPRGEAETCTQFETLDEAIESVPAHVATNYATDWEEDMARAEIVRDQDDREGSRSTTSHTIEAERKLDERREKHFDENGYF